MRCRRSNAHCALFLQPFASYTTKTNTGFTVNTESTCDWENSQRTIPLNFMVSQIFKIGKPSVSFQIGGRCYGGSPSGGPEWGIRANFTLLFPTWKHEAPATSYYQE